MIADEGTDAGAGGDPGHGDTAAAGDRGESWPAGDEMLPPPIAEHTQDHVEDHPELGPPLRPLPPLAKRLNRNALTVAAALAGVTVLTVVILTRPRGAASGGAPSPTAGLAAVPMPARPAFLDQPPREPEPSGDTHGRGAPGRGAAQAAGDSGGLPIPPPVGGQAAGPSLEPTPASNAAGTGAGAAQSPRHQAYQAALMSRVFVSAHARAGVERASGEDRDSLVPVVNVSAAAEPIPPVTPVMPVAPALRLSAAASPYTVLAGTVIAGLLVTGVNSDLPGEVLGQTSHDVYDSRTQQILLIPRGSRLIGSYDNRSVGTGRLVVGWTRLILPDGRSVTLPRLAGTDGQGQAGLHDQVDHHYGRVYGAALLTSALTAGIQLSQPQQSALYAAPSSRQVAAGALGQTMGDVSLESARRGLDVLPTVVIRPGQPFNVFLAGDLTFDAPYASLTAAAAR